MRSYCQCANIQPTKTLAGKPAQKVRGDNLCPICKGTGWCDQCRRCDGCGMIRANDPGKGVVINSVVCPDCSGHGKVLSA